MKFWDTLLLGLISWDFFVGADKVYGDNEKCDNPYLYKFKTVEENSLGYVEFLQVLEPLGLVVVNMIAQAESHSCTLSTNVAWSTPSISR
jgi:hypothetical protein